MKADTILMKNWTLIFGKDYLCTKVLKKSMCIVFSQFNALKVSPPVRMNDVLVHSTIDVCLMQNSLLIASFSLLSPAACLQVQFIDAI